MNINKPVILTSENEKRFYNFIVFEPASSRISEQDILFKGAQVKHTFEIIQKKLLVSTDLKTQIIQNRLAKINQMLELLSNHENILISKFFDRVWRRYSHISNLGEYLLDFTTYMTCFPEYHNKKMGLLAKRIDASSYDDFQAAAQEQQDDFATVEE
ncbi:hypothetical protein ACFLZV_00235 [Candidatus Margulisiibacteriota bacterium]